MMARRRLRWPGVVSVAGLLAAGAAAVVMDGNSALMEPLSVVIQSSGNLIRREHPSLIRSETELTTSGVTGPERTSCIGSRRRCNRMWRLSTDDSDGGSIDAPDLEAEESSMRDRASTAVASTAQVAISSSAVLTEAPAAVAVAPSVGTAQQQPAAKSPVAAPAAGAPAAVAVAPSVGTAQQQPTGKSTAVAAMQPAGGPAAPALKTVSAEKSMPAAPAAPTLKTVSAQKSSTSKSEEVPTTGKTNETVSVSTPKKLEALMKFQGLKYDAVAANSKVQGDIQAAVCKVVVDSIRHGAVAAGLPETGSTAIACHKVVLSRGSVVARAEVSIPSEMNLAVVIKRLEADVTLQKALVDSVEQVTGVKGVTCNAPLISESEAEAKSQENNPTGSEKSAAGAAKTSATTGNSSSPVASATTTQAPEQSKSKGSAMTIAIIVSISVLVLACIGMSCFMLRSSKDGTSSTGSYRDRQKAKAASQSAGEPAVSSSPGPVAADDHSRPSSPAPASSSYKDRLRNRGPSKVAQPSEPEPSAAAAAPTPVAAVPAAAPTGSYRDRMKSRTATGAGQDTSPSPAEAASVSSAAPSAAPVAAAGKAAEEEIEF